MANLVSPGYKQSALINRILQPNEERIIEFKGLNKRIVIEEGEMSDMWNLTPDRYPLLMPRKPRGTMEMPEGTMRPIQILRRFDKIGMIVIDEPAEGQTTSSISFYYDGEKIDEVTGLSTESRAVAINNRMCFFPDKTCIDITLDGVQDNTFRSLEANFEAPQVGTAVYVSQTETYIDVTKGLFDYDDAINIVGTLGYTPSGGTPTTMDVNVSCIIESIDKGGTNDTTDRIYLPANTFIEVEGASNISLVDGTTISRSMPDLDFIVEWNNRLWGCSNEDNTIYASKLGDPSNWQYFQGTSMDSYYAEQGTDEVFTGIAEYSGHLLFFKPNSIARVYGTSPSTYQITNAKAFGVEHGSSRSVLTINDTVFYKSSIGIMAYQGGVPFCISDKIDWKMKNVVAGTEGRKYYASCIVKEKDREEYKGRLLVFDISKGMWHLEDDMRFTDACKIEDTIYCTTSAADVLVCDTDVFCAEDLMCGTDYYSGEITIINPEEPTEEYTDYDWMAVFGPFDEYLEEHKIYSKLALRLKANGTASATVYISINEGPWEQVEHYATVSTKGDFIPIIPRRCDRYSVKIEGTGNCEMKSLTRRVRRGSFGRL